MFSFFKRPSVNIHSVTLPDIGWKKMEDSASAIKWLSPNDDGVATINFIKLVPDLPTIKDANVLRDFYRSRLAPSNGGLIQVDIISMHGVPSVKCIFKIRCTTAG